MQDLWIEVDLGALKHNLRQVRGLVGDGVRTMAVVKANGFGHGYVKPARAFVEAGADALGVTRLDEALTLRDGGIAAPVLVFAPIQAENARRAVEAGLELTVTGLQLVQAISEAADRLGKPARVHAKVDTGMGRLGLSPAEARGFIESAKQLPNVELAGIYTHFASAADPIPAKRQLEAFLELLDGLKAAGTDYGLAHAANSAAILRLPESHLDMVRPGTMLYGQYPSAHVPRSLDLKPTWKLKARICDIRTLPAGSRIGYGGEYTTRRQTRTAVLPVGYADGFTLAPEGPIYRQSVLKFAARKISRNLYVEVRGKRAPVLGRVAMQMIVADVTDVEGVSVGDEAVVPALRIPTSALIPRVYADSGS